MKTVYQWQARQWQLIADLMAANRLPHALLFHGEPDIGKFHFAQVLAETVLCSSQAVSACGFCKQCALSKGGFHPDLLILEPDGAGNNIKIDAVRELIQFLSKTSLQGGWKVIIINQAEKLNTNAANALLKVLEEPSRNTLLILVCSDLSRMMATVKSRCRQIPFPRPTASDAKSWLSDVITANENLEQLLEAASWRPLRALRLASEGWSKKNIELQHQWLSVIDGSLSPLECAAECCQIEGEQAFDWLYYQVAGLIRSARSPRERRLYFRFIDRLGEAKQLVQGNSNPNKQLLWEELMLDLRAYGRC